MKISKTFRLSEEAIKILDLQANATQFLEELILDTPSERKLEVVSLGTLMTALDEKLKNIALPDGKKTIRFESTPVGPNTFFDLPSRVAAMVLDETELKGDEFELAVEAGVSIPKCCTLKNPCKHWQNDSNREGYVNTFTGGFREYEV